MMLMSVIIDVSVMSIYPSKWTSTMHDVGKIVGHARVCVHM